MARVISQSPFRRDYQNTRFDPSRATVGSDKWLSPEGVKAAVAITDTVGGVVANTVAKKMDKDAILKQLDEGRQMAELARLARKEGEGQKVKELQQMILAQGGALPGFGVDAKFGDETAGALRKLQQKRATQIFGKGARPEQFNQYDIAQKQQGNILSRGFEGMRALMGDDARYNEMQAAADRAQALEDRALARRSAAAAYRRAAGAETMAERRAATADAMSAFDRQRAATLSGLAAGQGQQQIAQNLQRLFPGRRPQRVSSGRTGLEGLPRDIEKDFQRSESNLKQGQLALKFQKENGYASPAFRKLSNQEALLGNFTSDQYIPSSEYLPDSINQKLRSSDEDVRAQGLAEGVNYGQQSVRLAENYGEALGEAVEMQKQAHRFMSEGKGITMYAPRGSGAIRTFFNDPLYSRAIQGFDIRQQQTESGSGALPAGAIGQNADGSFIFAGDEMPSSARSKPTTGVGATAAATETPQALFGSDEDIAAMGGKPPAKKQEAKKPAAKKEVVAKPKKKKASRRRPRRKIDAEKIRAQLNDDEPRRVAAQRRNQGRTEVRTGAGMTPDTVTPVEQARSERRLNQELGNARRGRTPTPVKRRRPEERPKATMREIDDAMRASNPKLFSKSSKAGRRNRAKFRQIAKKQGIEAAKAAFAK